MNKTAILLLASILSLSTGGCSYLSDFMGLRNEAENKIEPNGISVNTTADSAVPETQVLEGEAAELSDNQKIVGLIPVTNPNTRVRSIATGRQDPFSAINVQPQIEIEEDDSTETNTELPPKVTSTPTFEPSDDELLESSLEEDDEFSEPTLAKKVVITGVVKVDGKDKIIINAPEESTSRYVEVGQYISNGQILVKSIDFNNFPTPLVILEQFGVEVAREVGESADSEETEFISQSASNKLPNS